MRLHTVVEKTIVPDLLETGWQHMHQKTTDEFRVAECNLPLRVTGFYPLAEKVTESCETERILLFEMAILWV